MLFSEAMKNGFENDVVLQRKRDSYYRELIITSFVESVIASKVSVSNDDVRLYYKRNKGEFTRVLDEVRIEQYIVKSKKVADRLVDSFNSKKNIDLSKFDIEFVKTETVQRGTFAKNIDNMLFVKRRRVVGPVVLGKDISVLKVLDINKQGSIKGLNDVYDEIYQRIFKIKSIEVQESLLDSLKKTVNISINPKYQ